MNVNTKQQNHQQSDHLRSWWHSPFVGYPLAVVFTACAFLIPLAERSLGIQDYFIEPPFVIATLLVGWFWGIGPALLALLIAVLALDYWIIPPLGNFAFFLWPDIVSFAPFIIIQLIIIGLVVLQKRYRERLLLAHQAVSKSAEDLAESNQALTGANIKLDRANQALAQSNDQLEQANRVKDLFLSRASHELKTPITTIQGQAQLALRRLARQQKLPTDFAFLPAHLAKVEAQTYRLNLLVNDLLNLSSLRSGKLPLQIAPCDVCLLCRNIIEDQRALVDHPIDLKLPPDPLILQADEGRLSQVVSNLVVNAIKYSPPDSIVCVDVSLKGTRLILAVHNNGSVIPQEQQENIFEPFYRTREAQTSATQGWGLGLAISKEIVEQHGGRLCVESSEEKGTTFFVALPLHYFSGADSSEL